MSGNSEWNIILHKAEEIRYLATQNDWVAIPRFADELDKRLRLFFESYVADLSEDEQIRVREEGYALMSLIAEVQQQIILAKQDASVNVGRMAKGRKGVSAYKKA